ncbi:hypothetical protein [Mucilaginibacter sp. dw_454]|uniref:hypothetical protein n=1 Tax=Mucilaginibacter sp. dw_454 TaxID=2720079 RepID=UPI001BD3F21C|nr:hypothetical protein [Mucilaginibacter sp. dw_454]
MKKLISYTFIILTALCVVVACRKSDNPKLKGLTEQVPEPQLTKDVTTDQVIAVQDPEAFNAKFTVGDYFPSETPPKSMDVVIIKNNDRTNQKVFKAGITSFPTTLTLTGADLKTLFGIETVLGDSYDIGVTITTKSGTVVPAFSAYSGAASYGPGVTSQGVTGAINDGPYGPATPQINYTAICKFDMAAYGVVGTSQDFTVVQDDWEDYAPGSVIPVKIIDATHLSFRYGTDKNPKDIVIAINPADNSTSVDKTDFGTYTGAPYPDYFAASVPGSANVVKPCDLTVGVNLNITVSAGSYGNFILILKTNL